MFTLLYVLAAGVVLLSGVSIAVTTRVPAGPCHPLCVHA